MVASTVEGAERLVVVGAQIEVEQCGLGTRRVKGGAHLSAIALDVATALCLHLAGEFTLCELGVANQHGREELVLEGNPVEWLGHLLLLVRGGREGLSAFVVELVGEFSQTVLVGVTLLNLTCALLPLNIYTLFTVREFVSHAYSLQSYLHQVTARLERVGQVDIARCIGLQTHGQCGVGLGYGGEDVVGRLDGLPLVVEKEVHRGVAAAEEADGGHLVLLHVILDGSRSDASTLAVHGESDEVVLNSELLLFALSGCKEEGCRVSCRLELSFVSQGGFGLLLELSLALLHLRNRVIIMLLGLQLLFTGAAVPAEANQQQGNQYKSGNGVFVHKLFLKSWVFYTIYK